MKIRGLWRRFAGLDFRLQAVWIFCLYGLFLNTVFLIRDMQYGGILWRLHAGFWILYAGQTVFLLLKERMVCVLSVLQALMAFLTSGDFTFVPLLRVIGYFVFLANGGFTVDEIGIYKYVFMSACLTLELLKSCWMFMLLPAPRKKKETGNAEKPDGSA